MKLIEVVKENKNDKIIKLLGMRFYSKEVIQDSTKEKWIFGIFKRKKNRQVKELFFLGIRFYRKKYVDMETIAAIVKNETKAAIMVSNLHQKVFPQFKNINYGKDVVLVATGPTLKKYNPIKGAVHIGVNRAFQVKNFKIDYLFTIDWQVVQDYANELQNYDCIKFCGQHSNPDFSVLSSDLISCHIPETFVYRAGAYRYFSNTWDDKIFNDISSCPLMDFGSATFPALHFALYTNPRRLYLVGCDCTLGGYWDGREQKIKNNDLMNHTIEGYEKFKNFALTYYPETEIISVNPVSLRGMFKDLDQVKEEYTYAKINN